MEDITNTFKSSTRNLSRLWRRWRFPYLAGVLTGVLIAIILAENETFKGWLLHLGSLEYIGALFAGMLFVSSFTVAISMVVIGIMTENIHPMALALIGGVGAVMGDYLVFKFVRSHIGEELALLVGKENTSYVKTILRSKYIAWTLPIIGMLIIASPLPDEMGVSLLGLSNMSEGKFILLSYVSNTLGILAIASVAAIL
jgi:hypothetical protein